MRQLLAIRALALVFAIVLIGISPATALAVGPGEDCPPEDKFSDLKTSARAAISSSYEECSQDFVTDMLSRSSPTSTALRHLLRPDTQVIAIGEVHNFGAGRDGYLKLFKQFEAAGFTPDCITWEYAQDGQPLIDSAINNPHFKAKTYIKKLGLWGGTQGFQLVEIARNKKIKIFPVDKGAGSPTLDRLIKAGNVEALLNLPNYTTAERNEYMARRIKQLILERKCSKIVHVGGIKHLSAKSSLGQLLAPAIRIVSIGLQPVSDLNSGFGFLPTALRCVPGTAPFNPGDSGFAISNKATEALLSPSDAESGEGLRWRDFDAILFLPTAQ